MASPNQSQGIEGSAEGSSPTGSRRSLFAWTFKAIASVIGLGVCIPVTWYVVSPALKRRESTWAEVGNIADLPPGEPQEFEYARTITDGWRVTAAKKAVWAVKRPDGSISVFSPLCPHLGCGYGWDPDARQFKCPCHGSVYDVAGKVLGGPAPRPLDALPAKVEDGKLWVMYKEFKSGLTHPVEL